MSFTPPPRKAVVRTSHAAKLATASSGCKMLMIGTGHLVNVMARRMVKTTTPETTRRTLQHDRCPREQFHALGGDQNKEDASPVRERLRKTLRRLAKQSKMQPAQKAHFAAVSPTTPPKPKGD